MSRQLVTVDMSSNESAICSDTVLHIKLKQADLRVWVKQLEGFVCFALCVVCVWYGVIDVSAFDVSSICIRCSCGYSSVCVPCVCVCLCVSYLLCQLFMLVWE